MPRGAARGTTDPARHSERMLTWRGRPSTGEHAAVVAPLGGNKLESSTSDSCPVEALQLDLFCCRLMLNHAGRNGIIIIYLSVSIEMETERVENERNITAVDLFAGCGGMSLGFEKAGFDVKAAFEYWKPAISVYEKNFDHPVVQQDLSDVDGAVDKIRPIAPTVIFGGPPCQDFSTAGHQDESRGRAVLSVCYAKIVSAVRPDYFVMENVATIRNTKSFLKACEIFEEAGYGLTKKILDASYCGVPQKRKRMFVVGALGEQADFLLDELEDHLASKPMSIRDYLGDSLGIEYYFRIPTNYNRRAIFSIDEPSMTIRGVDRPIPKGYKGHPNDPVPVSAVRILTPKERSYIQTFPESFEFFGNKSDMNVMIGNAVPVNLARYVGDALMRYIKSKNGGDEIARS